MYRVTLHVALHSGTGALSRGPNNVSGTIGFNGAARDHFYALVVDFHGVEINRKGGKRERESFQGKGKEQGKGKSRKDNKQFENLNCTKGSRVAKLRPLSPGNSKFL